MPVIRGQGTFTVIPAEQREKLVEQLQKELSGEVTPNGPVIFEIPFEQLDKFDVLVVWDVWKPIRSEDRSEIILSAYQEKKTKIAQALGVTYHEAIEQQVLPYAVVPMVRPGEVDFEMLKKEMIVEGGIALPNGNVELRLPTMALAEQAHRKLVSRLSNGYWSIVQTVSPISLPSYLG
jgi:hypothetical protein